MTCKDCYWLENKHNQFGDNVCVNPVSEFCTEHIADTETHSCNEIELKEI